MAISIIFVSLDSSEESMGTSTRRVILFGTILATIPDTTLSVIPPSTHVDTTLIPIVLPTIPPSPDYTPASPNYTPASPNYSPVSDTDSNPSEDPSSDHIPPLPATSPFLSSTDDSSDSDIPDTPPSPTHGTPFTKTTLSTQRSPAASDHFSSDDSLRDSSSSSSSKTSSYSSVNVLSDSASSRSSLDHSLPTPSSGMRHSYHLCLSSIVLCSADHLPSPKRIRSFETDTNLEVSLKDIFEPYVPRGTELEMYVDVVRSDGIEIDPEIQGEINECIAYADALRDRGTDARVIVETVDRDEVETGTRGPVKVRVDRVTHLVTTDDIPEPAQEEGVVESTDMLERIGELERENIRLRDMMDVEAFRLPFLDYFSRALGAHNAAINLEPLIGNRGNRNEGNRNEENGNGNGNGGGNGYNFRGFMHARYALTWWNYLKRTIRIEAAFAMSWAELMKLMTEVYCLRIEGNVIAAEPTKLQDVIRIANNLMDQKLKGYARSAKNKSRLENNPRDNRGQQPVFKQQNIRGQNVARAYTAGNNKKKGDCKVTVTPNTQRSPVENQPSIICYECGRPRHFRKDCPKLRNQNCRNQTGNKNGNKTGNQTGGNEATTRAYAIGGGGGANLNSNVVTGMFLLNNCYAFMLFDLSADRSFVSCTFSVLLHVAPSTLDSSYAVELADDFRNQYCP
nr:hypothetical protein [Tanacetum cinerariifolium]